MKVIIRFKGGAGSGHHGHAGVPGQRGGSLPRGSGDGSGGGSTKTHRFGNLQQGVNVTNQFIDDLRAWGYDREAVVLSISRDDQARGRRKFESSDKLVQSKIDSLLKPGAIVPPIIAMGSKDNYLTPDGNHRLAAIVGTGGTEILAHLLTRDEITKFNAWVRQGMPKQVV